MVLERRFGDTIQDIVLHNGRGVLNAAARTYGVVPAKVLEIYDGENQRHKQGYVQVYFPWLQSDSDEKLFKPWARVAVPDANQGVGFKMTPQKDDEVLVAFEHGDMHVPYVLGALWNGQINIPEPTTPGDGQDMDGHNSGPKVDTPDLKQHSLSDGNKVNKVMYIKSLSGNLVVLDDNDGTVRFCDKEGNSRIALEADTIKIVQSTGDMTVYAAKTICFDCETFVAQATSSISLQAGGNINIAAGKNVSVHVGPSKEDAAGGEIEYDAGKSYVCMSDKNVQVIADSTVQMTCGSNISLTSEDNDLKLEATLNIDLKAAKDITFTTDQSVNVEGKATVSVMSANEATFEAKGDFKANGLAIMLN